VDKENICLVPVNDVKELEEAIKLLCVDNELRKKIAATAEKLSKDFSWDKIAKMHKELYQEVVGNFQ
jgi:glycosyltransferase involved in cell wall biosynthesis